MTPEESQVALGEMLARALDSADGQVVTRAVLVYEIAGEDEGQSRIAFEGTEHLTYTDHLGLLRTAQINAEAVILRAHLEEGD